MNILSKLKQTLKSKSGISLMMVIGTMALLFAISASVIGAAFANLGQNARQNETNRIRVLSESIHRSIKYALESSPGDPSSLSSQLVWKLYDSAAATPQVTPADIILAMDIDALNAANDLPFPLQLNSITLSWLHEDVKITPSTPFIEGINFGGAPGFVDIPQVLRRPRTADINATLTVTVEIEAVKFLGIRNRIITTVATYEFTEGFLTEEVSTMYNSAGPEPLTPYTMGFITDEYGTWSLIAYETIDNIQP